MRILKEHFGKILRKRREEMGFDTQEAFAKKLGTEQSTVNRWETGRFSPDDQSFREICRILNVESEYFVGEQEPDAKTIFDYIRKLETSLAESASRLVALEEKFAAGAKEMPVSGASQDLHNKFAKFIEYFSWDAVDVLLKDVENITDAELKMQRLKPRFRHAERKSREIEKQSSQPKKHYSRQNRSKP